SRDWSSDVCSSDLARAVVEPVMDHELDPGGGDKVQRCGRLEVVAARHQQVADFARVRHQQRVVECFRLCHARIDVAPEVDVGGAFGGVFQNIAGAVLGTGGQAAL